LEIKQGYTMMHGQSVIKIFISCIARGKTAVSYSFIFTFLDKSRHEKRFGTNGRVANIHNSILLSLHNIWTLPYFARRYCLYW